VRGEISMRNLKKLGIYLLTSLLVLVISWEYQRSVAASLVSTANLAGETESIPQEAIRLRILANSDSPRDQWLKREIRDEVVQHITKWVEGVETIDAARDEVRLSLVEIDNIVKEVIEDRGFSYTHTVEYGQIQFPSKLYGDKLYPAGDYEGLLITVGEGLGDNWWCVLFPPLCFVDFGTDEGEVRDPDQAATSTTEITTATTATSESAVEVRFFIVEIFEKIKNMFA
jgi:stage II sporulation protein R